MTPEAKAKELIQKFHIKEGAMLPKVLLTHAKACALICVEECINGCGTLQKEEYWNQVKLFLKQ